MTTDTHAKQVEEALDLKRQLNALDGIANSDMIFRDTSPPTRWDFVYSTQTGERIVVKSHRLISVLEKRLPDGTKAFTSFKENVPEYRLGEVKCFLARGSREREVVDELNISPGYYCNAEHLSNDMAAIVHAEHRHTNRWRQYQRHLERQERDLDREERRQQTAAMLQLATGNTNAHGSDWLDAMQSPVVAAAIKGAAAEGVMLAAEEVRKSLAPEPKPEKASK